jgi:hypothetical protein
VTTDETRERVRELIRDWPTKCHYKIMDQVVSPLVAERDRLRGQMQGARRSLIDGMALGPGEGALPVLVDRLVAERDAARQVARIANNNCADFAEALGLDRDCYGDEIIEAAHLLLWLHAEAQWQRDDAVQYAIKVEAERDQIAQACDMEMASHDTTGRLHKQARARVAALEAERDALADRVAALQSPDAHRIDDVQQIARLESERDEAISILRVAMYYVIGDEKAVLADRLNALTERGVATQPSEPPGKVTTLHVTATRYVSDGHTDQRVRYEWEGDSWEGWLISYGIVDGVDEAYVMREDDGKAWVVLRENVTEIDSPAVSDTQPAPDTAPRFNVGDEVFYGGWKETRTVQSRYWDTECDDWMYRATRQGFASVEASEDRLRAPAAQPEPEEGGLRAAIDRAMTRPGYLVTDGEAEQVRAQVDYIGRSDAVHPDSSSGTGTEAHDKEDGDGARG